MRILYILLFFLIIVYIFIAQNRKIKFKFEINKLVPAHYYLGLSQEKMSQPDSKEQNNSINTPI